MTNKYLRTIYGIDKDGNPGSLQVDVYNVLEAYPTKNPALDHLIKKALCPGQRGHKDLLTDLDDIIKSAQRAKELVVNQLACTTEVTISTEGEAYPLCEARVESVIKQTTYAGPTTERPTSFSKLGTIYAFTNVIGGRRLKRLQNAAEGVCEVSRITHVLDAPIGAVVVGSYREHDKCVDGRHCFNMIEALAILQKDLGALAPSTPVADRRWPDRRTVGRVQPGLRERRADRAYVADAVRAGTKRAPHPIPDRPKRSVQNADSQCYLEGVGHKRPDPRAAVCLPGRLHVDHAPS